MIGDDRFETALESCARRVRDGEPLDRCLRDYPPAYRAELARLVSAAERAAALRRDPSPAFQESLERRLLAALPAEPTRRQSLGGMLRGLMAAPPKALVAVALVLLLLVAGSAGAVQASDASLPDSPLYGVKTAREWIELELTPNRQARVNVQSRHVAQRARELQQAIRLGKPARVVDALALRLAAATESLVRTSLDLEAQGNPQAARLTRQAIRGMARQVDALSPQAPPNSRAALDRLATFLQAKDRQLTAALRGR